MKLERERVRKYEIVCERSSVYAIAAGRKIFDQELRLSCKLVTKQVASRVEERERVLKLFGECAAAGCFHVQRKTVLRIVEIQHCSNLFILKDSLAHHPRNAEQRSEVTGDVARDSSIRSDPQHLFARLLASRTE